MIGIRKITPTPEPPPEPEEAYPILVEAIPGGFSWVNCVWQKYDRTYCSRIVSRWDEPLGTSNEDICENAGPPDDCD